MMNSVVLASLVHWPGGGVLGQVGPSDQLNISLGCDRDIAGEANIVTDTTANLSSPMLASGAFRDALVRFHRLISAHDQGRPFTNFHEGIAAAEEGYKPRLRDHALARLDPSRWSRDQIGSGSILQHVIDAIEIQDSRVTLVNNLVFWQNRFGHANREHRVLLEAVSDFGSRRQLEELFYDLYRGEADEGATFDRLSELIGAKYPLMAYLFFLRDSDRFMPIQPTTYDRAFRNLGIDLTTLKNCNWTNYQRYNSALVEVQKALVEVAGLAKTRLVDAHSFCWILETFKEPDEDGKVPAGKHAGRIVGGPEKSIIAMRYSILNTVRSSNGQIVERTVKDKTTSLSEPALDAHLGYLLVLQDGRCALTGIPFDFHTIDGDRHLRPSPDRIDSTGHYEPGNIQVVCQFINFWKGTFEDAEFRRLLMLVRGDHRTEAELSS
ncbi:MAG: hypothetical protein Q8O54_08950 [Brevundimonas sp.]|nr:hypothetical protein [Brevundimonas sp.]